MCLYLDFEKAIAYVEINITSLQEGNESILLAFMSWKRTMGATLVLRLQ